MNKPPQIMFNSDTAKIVNKLRDAFTEEKFPDTMAALSFTYARCLKTVLGPKPDRDGVNEALGIIVGQILEGLEFLQNNPEITMQSTLMVVDG
jgi:hypothetical protein